jgi:hypothetical protein
MVRLVITVGLAAPPPLLLLLLAALTLRLLPVGG